MNICGAHLNLSVSSLQKSDAQQNALFEHSVVLGADYEVDHQLCSPNLIQETLNFHHAAACLV